VKIEQVQEIVAENKQVSSLEDYAEIVVEPEKTSTMPWVKKV
jgi:hypothetical protein